MWGEGAGEGLLFRSSSLGRVSVDEESDAREAMQGRMVPVPSSRLEVSENKRGYFVLALRCALVQIFHRIFPQSLFSGTSGLGRAILVVVTFFLATIVSIGGWY